MGTFDARGASASTTIDMTGAHQTNHQSQIGNDPWLYVWQTQSGNRISAYSLFDDIVAASGAPPTAGTVSGVQMHVGSALEYIAAGFEASITTMLTSEGYWRAILAGETDFFSPAGSDVSFRGAGDFVELAAGEHLTGAADTAVIEQGSFAGDAISVAGAGAQLTGGDDLILIERSDPAASGLIMGDAQYLQAQTQLVGGNDTIDASASTVAVTARGDAQEVLQDAGPQSGGDDVLIGGTGNDALIGDFAVFRANGALMLGNDSISGGAGHDTLVGDIQSMLGLAVPAAGTGMDTLDGGGGNDTLSGDFGDDRVHGGGGNDLLLGGEGIDTAVFDRLAVAVTVDLATGLALGQGSDTLSLVENAIGSSKGDALAGNAAANLLSGGGGSDTLNGRAGADTMDGGAGNDRFHVDSSGDLVLEAAGGGSDTVIAGTSYTLPAGASVEFLRALESDSAIDLTGNAAAQEIRGNDSAAGNQLFGEGGNDTLYGLGGNDLLSGGAGIDLLIGGTGNDIYDRPGGDTIVEQAGEGIDQVRAEGSFSLSGIANVENLLLLAGGASDGTGNDLANQIEGNAQNNRLNGGIGDDTLTGGGGNDTLAGGAGGDRLEGGLGDDLYVLEGADVVVEAASEGIDTIESATNYSLAALAHVENLVLTGDRGAGGTGNALGNTITGNAKSNILGGADGNDTLDGGDGADTLQGGEGSDLLAGGPGNDTLSGGTQADTFHFAATAAGTDRILDFEAAADRFDLSGGQFTALSIAPNGDAVLTHGGGIVRVASPPSLSLAQWNALVLPGGATVAAAETAAPRPLDHTLSQSAWPAHENMDWSGHDWIFA